MKTWKGVLGQIAQSGKFSFECYNAKILPSDITKWNFRQGWVETKSDGQFKIKDCKLIARPVSYISDEEIFELIRGDREDLKFKLRHYGDSWSYEQFLYLLSIGVLPESLADKDVIWGV